MRPENQAVFQKFLQIQRERTNQRNAKEIVLDPRFVSQNAFINSTARFLDAQCSRRAGKSNGLGLRFIRTMKRYPKKTCLYVGLTRESSKEIMWPVLEELNDQYNLRCRLFESNLVMEMHNGARLKLVGADQKNFIKKLKGKKHPGIGVDEAQDFGSHLQTLVDDVLSPCMADFSDPWLALTGTPGPVPHGYWYQVAYEKKFGFEHHAWTLLENPFLPDPEGFIQDLCRRKGWTAHHPTLLREWRNQWVLDVESLWIKYRDEKNHYGKLPVPHDQMTLILGVDLGFKDADAMALIGWHESSPETFLIEESVIAKQGITELVQEIERFQRTYEISKIVIDEGGLGKKIAEEIRRQKHIPLHQADKALKQQNAAFLNDALRLGHFRAKSDSRFAKDSYQVQIDWEKSKHDKIVVKPKPHSDIIDAVLYAFKESPAYAFQAPKAKSKPGTPEWNRETEDGLFEAAQAYFKKEEDPFSES